MKLVFLYGPPASIIGGLFVTVAFLLVNVSMVQAAPTINPPGSWNVTGTGASGAVGDTVTVEIAITYVTDSYAGTDFYIKTDGEARQKLSFVGVVPGAASVSAEQIDWPKTEFEAGVTKKYKVQVRIDRGTVGDEIEGFYVSTYTGFSIMHGVADDIKVKVIAKSSPTPTAKAVPTPTKATLTPTPTPTKIPITPTAALLPIASAMPTATSQPIVVAAPIPTPVNPIDPDGDGLPNDEEAIWGSNPAVFDTDGDGTPDGDEIRNGTNPSGDMPTPLPVIEPQPSSLPLKSSAFNRMIASVRGRFQVIGAWFADLF